MKNAKKIASLLLALLIAYPISACAEKVDDKPAAVTDDPATTTAEVVPEETQVPYDYSDESYDGYDFTILCQDTCDWANPLIVPEALNGELINDALYNRNKKVEDTLNVKILNERVSKENIASYTNKVIAAADDVYDLIFFPIDNMGAAITKKHFVNLAELEALQLDKPWWDQIVVNTGYLGDKIFYASSDISLFVFEATWVLYFNQNIMDNLGLDYPYDIVRNGGWTIDRLAEYAAAGASINGQETFKYDKDGTAQYGLVSHDQLMHVLLCGSNELLIGYDDENMPYFNADNEHFYAVADKIASLTATAGQYVDRANMTVNNTGNSIALEFKNSRFLMLAETLGHVIDFRDFEDEFGVLPIPKYDENQEDYRSMIATWGTLMTVIPMSNVDTDRTAVITDMLAYESYISLMEPYYDTYLTQKGVRNDDSAEMLAIIRDTRTVNVGVLYGWTSSILPTVTSSLVKGNSDLASKIAAATTSVEKAIEKTLSNFE